MKQTHEDLAREILGEGLIRQAIQQILEGKFREKTLNMIREQRETEFAVRKVCQRMLGEYKELFQEGTDPIPNRSTGINVLEDLLKKIIPSIEADYKKMTTDPEQRHSFRAHIMKAIKTSMLPIEVNAQVGKIEEGILKEVQLLDELDVIVGDSNPSSDPGEEFVDVKKKKAEDRPEFIDINKPKDAVEDEFEDFAIPGEDETGRNFAAITFKKVEKQILEAYEMLSNDEDRDTFKEFLQANVLLYLDKFEDELQTMVQEPSSEVYDSAKEEQN